jgi:dolichol kinase
MEKPTDTIVNRTGITVAATNGPAPARAARGGGMRRELMRKSFHMSSMALPLFAWIAPRAVGLAVLLPLAVIAVVVDSVRLRFRGPRYVFLRATRTMLRVHERRGFAGATYMAVAYATAMLAFPQPIAVAGMLYNALGDAAAALVGKRWGRHRTSWGKSWEGYAAGMATSMAVGFAVPGIPPAAAVIGAVAASTLEFLPLPLDDNLRVTLGGALACWLAATLLQGVW